MLKRRSYAGRLVVHVTDAEMSKLDSLAAKAGATREQVASAILRSRLAQISTAKNGS